MGAVYPHSPSKLDAPGSAYGPCQEGCRHFDCADSRVNAQSSCQRCGEPIGYERSFYRVGSTGAPGPLGDPGHHIYAHSDCGSAAGPGTEMAVAEASV
jgi:fermentation-respiration switch protein FrsA (DUF1100 family)